MKLNLLSALIVLALFCLLHASLPTSSVEAQSQSNLADTWTWPLSPWQDFVIGDESNGGIGYGKVTGTTRHGGLDVWHKGGDTKTSGQPVYAMADGIVSYLCNSDKDVLDCQGFGKAVLVSHNLPPDRAYEGETRITSVYGHLDASKPLVKPGTPVKKGETIIGYLAPTGRCGSICTTAHLHFGIRKGHYGDPGFPSSGWGYVPIPDTKDFSQWIEPIGFISDREELWRFQPPQTVTINFPWVYNFSTCDLRPIRVRLGNELLFSSAPGDEKLVRTFGKFLWFGTYTLNVEYYDVPKAPPVKIEWPFAPNRLACSAEATFPTSTLTVTRTSGIVATLTPLPSATAVPLGKIAYLSNNALMIMNPDGSGKRQVLPTSKPDGNKGHLHWIPGADKISFTNFDGIYTVRLDGSDLSLLIPGHASDHSWSPDGTQIVFVVWQDGGLQPRDLYIRNINTGNQIRLTNDGVSHFPAWSPDGKQIAYGKNLTRVTEVIDLDTRVKTIVFDQSNGWLDWSPDGRKLAISVWTGSRDEIWLVDFVNPGGAIKVGEGLFFSWSPSGEQIAYEANGQIWVMNSNGTNKRLLGTGQQPAWQTKPPK